METEDKNYIVRAASRDYQLSHARFRVYQIHKAISWSGIAIFSALSIVSTNSVMNQFYWVRYPSIILLIAFGVFGFVGHTIIVTGGTSTLQPPSSQGISRSPGMGNARHIRLLVSTTLLTAFVSIGIYGRYITYQKPDAGEFLLLAGCLFILARTIWKLLHQR